MKLKALFIGGLLFCLSGCAAMKSSSANEADSLAEAKALHEDFVTKFNSNDVKGLVALYSKDSRTVLFPPGNLIDRGAGEIHDGFAAIGKQMPGAKLSFPEANYQPAGSSIVSWGLWEMQIPGPKGKSAKMKGRFTELLVRENGKLAILVDHASVPLTPPAAPKPAKKKAARKK